jgi:hypothetical protein
VDQQGNTIFFTTSGMQKDQSVSVIITGTVTDATNPESIKNCLEPLVSMEEVDAGRFGTGVPLVGIHHEDWIDRDRNDAELCFYGQAGGVTFNGQTMTAHFSGQLNIEIQRNSGA